MTTYELPNVGGAMRYPNGSLGTSNGLGAWDAGENIDAKIDLYANYLAQVVKIKAMLNAEANAAADNRVERVGKIIHGAWGSSYNFGDGPYSDRWRASARAILDAIEAGEI